MNEHLWQYDIITDKFMCATCHMDWTTYVKDTPAHKLCEKPKPKGNCDCGSETAGFNSHSHWCSTQKENK